MRWRDIRLEKPTEEDGDCAGDIIIMLADRNVIIDQWEGNFDGVLAWMPVSELPQPDLPGPIPDGWREVDKAVDHRSEMVAVKAWDSVIKRWVDCHNELAKIWLDDQYYIVPIDPPAPQYRPFASAAEFAPHADRWISRLHIANKKAAVAYRPVGYDDLGIWGVSGRESFKEMFEEGRTFVDDGTPFGVLVSPPEATK